MRNPTHLPAGLARSIAEAQPIGALEAAVDARVMALFEKLWQERAGAVADPLIRSDRLGPNNRIVLGLITRGEIAAVKIGGRYHVRASEWARFTRDLEEKQRAEIATAPAGEAALEDDVDAEADRVLAEMGLQRKAEPAQKRARGGRR